MKRIGADFWSGLALAGLGAYIISQAWGWEYLGADGPGPGFFPLWYGIVMLALSILLMAFSFREAQTVDWRGAGRAFAAWGALAAAIALLKLAGFVVCFAALTVFVVAVMYRRPVWLAATVGATAAAAFYAVFPLALGVKLP